MIDKDEFKYELFKYWMKITYPFRKFCRFIERLIFWFPVLWKDEDWDSQYLLDLVEFKLKRMSVHLDKYSHHLYKDRDVKEIKTVLSHIDHYNSLNSCDDKYVEQTKSMSTWELTPEGNRRFKSNLTKREKYLLKRNIELEKWHWNEIWRIISRKGRNWWD